MPVNFIYDRGIIRSIDVVISQRAISGQPRFSLKLYNYFKAEGKFPTESVTAGQPALNLPFC